MFCANCGKSLSDETKFCDNCGVAIGENLKSKDMAPKTTTVKGKTGEKTLMKVFGIILPLLGVFLILGGVGKNSDVNSFIEYGPNSGNGLIVFGFIFFIIGVVLLCMHFWLKNKNK